MLAKVNVKLRHRLSLSPPAGRWLLISAGLYASAFLSAVYLGQTWSIATFGHLTLLGLGAVFAGFLLLVASIWKLGSSGRFNPGADHKLVMTGVYGWIRHPEYAAMCVMVIGWALALANLPAVALGVAYAVAIDQTARREEAWLRERYPRYRGYAARVKRFVPGLY